MTETNKEIEELREEVVRLKGTNVVLFNKLTNMINEYNKMLAAITKHSNKIRDVIESHK